MRNKKVLSAALTAALMLPVAAIITAGPAQAAGCTYSNLTSTRVKNATCKSGAYAYRSGTTWSQSGAWASKGNFSYNWAAICYQYPGMIGIV